MRDYVICGTYKKLLRLLRILGPVINISACKAQFVDSIGIAQGKIGFIEALLALADSDATGIGSFSGKEYLGLMLVSVYVAPDIKRKSLVVDSY